VADDFIAAAAVGRVVDAVDHRHILEVERADTLQAGDVDAVLVRIGAAAMVGVDAAFRTEVVLRRAGIEAVACQRVLAGIDCNAADVERRL